jgi:hypothetical protein
VWIVPPVEIKMAILKAVIRWKWKNDEKLGR